MARETKIGLLVGMSFILCFAIILSRGTEPRPASDSAANPFAIRTESSQPSPNAIVSTRAPREPDVTHGKRAPLPPRRRQRAVPDRTTSGMDASTDDQADTPGRSRTLNAAVPRSNQVLDNRFTTRVGPIPAGRDAAAEVPRTHPPLSDHAARGSAEDRSTRGDAFHAINRTAVPLPELRSSTHPRRQTWQPTRQPTRQPATPPRGTRSLQDADSSTPITALRDLPAERSGTGRAVQPPVGESIGTHRVESGDSLTRIARRYYGVADPATLDAIYALNRDRMKSVDHIVVGWEIRLPKLNGMGALPDSGAAAAPARPPVERQATSPVNKADEAAPRRPVNTPRGREYEVKPGDLLSKIAVAHYGSARPAILSVILDANRGKVTDADTIRVGQMLLLPDMSPGLASDASDATAHATDALPQVLAAIPDPLRTQPAPQRETAESPANDRAARSGPQGGRGITWEWYQLKPGDIYSKLAAKHLGSARRWPEIAELNRDIFDDPSAVRSGVKIRMPLPAVASSGPGGRR